MVDGTNCCARSLIQCTLPWVCMVYERNTVLYINFFIAYVAALLPMALHSAGARARFMTALCSVR